MYLGERGKSELYQSFLVPSSWCDRSVYSSRYFGTKLALAPQQASLRLDCWPNPS